MSRSKEVQLYVISGYLRDVMRQENDYTSLFAVIIAYQSLIRGEAQYFGTAEGINSSMRFGDLTLSKDNRYHVLNLNDELIDVGYHRDMGHYPQADITIPYSICKHLANAVSFYSAIITSKLNAFAICIKLNISNDDEWIKQRNNGYPFNPRCIDIQFECIHLSQGRWQSYNVLVLTHKDFARKVHRSGLQENEESWKKFVEEIEEYYNLRQDESNLIKILLKVKWYERKWNLSILWDEKKSEDGYYYIGPKTEKDLMIDTFKKALGENKLKSIMKIVNIEKDDYP